MISAFVFAGAERTPERTAIVAGGRRLSYGEFARAIEAMVQAFEAQGLAGPGYAVVAIADLLQCWIVCLALRELGLTTAPAMSAENTEAMNLEGRCWVVTHPGESWEATEVVGERRGWGRIRAGWDGSFASPIETGRRRTDRLGEHLLQTSATTGKHKLVAMTRDFEASFLQTRAQLDGSHQDSRCALFNFGLWTGAGYKTAGGVWSVGGTVILHQLEPIHASLADPGLTHAVMLPDQAARLLAAPHGAFPFHPDMSIDLSGATPRQAQVDEIKTRIAPTVFNGLGATETQTIAVTRLETPEDRRWHSPIPERGLQIVDDADQPVAVGEIGRVRVSTRGGPQGYLGDPAATAAFFKDGYFYPGDLGQLRADGRLALSGRTTEVINVMGQKISPAPFEDQLCEQLSVSGVCLFARQDQAGDDELHLVIETPAPLEVSRLTEVVRQTLSGFPRARVHYLKELPRNANGKVLRGELQRRVAMTPV